MRPSEDALQDADRQELAQAEEEQVPAAERQDEGDRRWMWALALVLLGLESWLRRGRAESKAVDEPKGSSPQEARVA